MTKKLFPKHNVVNVYFEGKEVMYLEKVKERKSFVEYFRIKLMQSCDLTTLFGNYYMFPYNSEFHNTQQVYLKIGVREILSFNGLTEIIKGYKPKNENIYLETHKFKFKNSHYTIEVLKFYGYSWGDIVQNRILSDKKFRNNILRKFNNLSGDKLSKEQKKRLTCEEWLNLMHHMFLSLGIDYEEEALIYGLGNKGIQYNINKTR